MTLGQLACALFGHNITYSLPPYPFIPPTAFCVRRGCGVSYEKPGFKNWDKEKYEKWSLAQRI